MFSPSVPSSTTCLCIFLVICVNSAFLATINPISKFATPCTTPNREEGICVEISLCPILLNDILNEDNSTYEFVRQSRCGPANENPNLPKVCCGKHANFINPGPSRNDVESAPEQVQTVPFDVIYPKECGRQMSLSSRIFGGTVAELGEHPWMARMVHIDDNGKRSFGCGGFLILPRYVITAGHCIESDAIRYLGDIKEIQLGEHNTATDPDCEQSDGQPICAPPAQFIRVGKIYVHPKYVKTSPNRENDIALVPLKKDATYNNFVQPICLPRRSIMKVTQLMLAGWGLVNIGETTTMKFKVSIPIFNFTKCVSIYQEISVQLTDKQICAGGVDGKDSCSGDSGGPAMYQDGETWYAAGIVSFGVGCGQKEWPGIYTNVTSYLDWIDDIVLRRYARSRRKT